MHSDLARRCDVIEECYEYLLAYASMGVAGEEGSGKGSQVRVFLERLSDSLSGLSEAYSAGFAKAGLPQGSYSPFMAVLERDARDAHAAVEITRAQPVISSQLIDNLNASIHLRALLTDLFLVDEVVKIQFGPQAVANESAAGE